MLSEEVSSEERLEQSFESIIDPMDVIILDLIEALNINIANENLDELNTGSIVGMKCNLMFRYYEVINELLPLMSQGDFIPEFNKPINPKAKGKHKNFTIGKLMQKLISTIPFGLEFEAYYDSMNDGNISYVLRPLVIYRKINI